MIYVKIINDQTGSLKKGNYTWGVWCNGVQLAAGVISGHQRAKGWLPLLRKLVRQAKKNHTVPNEIPPAQLELILGLGETDEKV